MPEGIIGTGTVTISGSGAGSVDIALCPRTTLCAIKKMVVTKTALTGTVPTSYKVELFQQPLASAPTSGGRYSVVKATGLTIDAANILYREEFDIGEAPWVYAITTTLGNVSVWITPTGSDGTTAATFAVDIYAEAIEKAVY
jgi:hypothetical protein